MVPMKCTVLLALVILRVAGRSSSVEVSGGTADGTEEWGYIDVRQGAHMFWWLYYNSSPSPEGKPIVFWLQGGPGASGVGFGNFEEIGPLTTALTVRESTWLKVAHLLFVDNPVGTGFSYVDDKNLLTTTNKQVSDDLITFIKSFFKTHESLKRAPFYIVAESYGGKFASEVGVAIHKSISQGALDFNFQGVALGDTWVSPIDFLYAWGPLLKSFSLVDEFGNDYLNRYADSAAAELEKGNTVNATYIWGDMEDAVITLTDNVDFYNILNHESDLEDSLLLRPKANGLGARHLRKTEPLSLGEVMNGPIREKLGIIPAGVRWSESSGEVFGALIGDFMLDTISKVDELLALGVNVTIYSGQLDLICCTTGTEAWVQKMKWDGLAQYNLAQRIPLYCKDGQTAAFLKSHKNLSFYWIMNAGHMVPSDNPCMGLKLLSLITQQDEAVQSEAVANL